MRTKPVNLRTAAALADPEVSIIICTHNRRARLLRACASLSQQAYPLDRLELIVVDNASEDGTAEAVEEFRRASPFRCRAIVEPALGKSRALNTGAVAARGALLVFTDDDCEPRPEWLQSLTEPFVERDVGVVGGPVVSHFPPEVEADPEKRFIAHKFFGNFVLAEQLRELRGRELPLGGANLAVRAESFRRVGGFATFLGPVASRSGTHEEADLAWRVGEAGYRLLHQPRAVVDHYPDSSRLSRPAMRRHALATGRCAFLARHREPSRLAGRCLRTALVALELVPRGLRWLLSCPFSHARFVAEFRLLCAVGKLTGVWQNVARTEVLLPPRPEAWDGDD